MSFAHRCCHPHRLAVSSRRLAGTLAGALLLCAPTTHAGAQTSAARAVGSPTVRPWADPSPHQVRRVTVAPDVQLEVLDWGGTGPPLVFLAGLGATVHIFDDFAPRFRDQFHVYGITRRGFGASSAPAAGYDAGTRARDIVAVLDSLHLARVVLVGHSLAGDELSKVGASAPTRVRALVYLDAYDYGPARVKELHANPPPTALRPTMTASDCTSPAATAAFYARTLANSSHFPEAEVRARQAGRPLRRRPSVDAVSRTLEGTEPVDFRRVTSPALGIFETHPGGAAELFRSAGYARADAATRELADRYFIGFMRWLQEGRERFRAELAHATIVELPGAGHKLFLTQPDRVERAMRTFLVRTR